MVGLRWMRFARTGSKRNEPLSPALDRKGRLIVCYRTLQEQIFDASANPKITALVHASTSSARTDINHLQS
jgi:hypothetical protein